MQTSICGNRFRPIGSENESAQLVFRYRLEDCFRGDTGLLPPTPTCGVHRVHVTRVPTPPASQVAPHSGLHLTCTCAFLFAQANPVQLPGETKGKVHDDLGDKENVGGQDTGGEADGGDSGEDDGEDDGEDSGGDSGAEEGDGVMEFVELDGAQDCDLALVITPALSCCIHISRYIQRVQFVTRQHDRNQCMSHDRNRAARPKPSSSTTETEIRLCKRTRQLAYSNFW